MELKKCDIWAFGVLAWEVLLDGRCYTSQLTGLVDGDSEASMFENIDPAMIVVSAMLSARVGTDVIQRAIFKGLFKRTLEVDPNLRVSELDSLPIMSKWR